jgi:hypothetical protein
MDTDQAILDAAYELADAFRSRTLAEAPEIAAPLIKAVRAAAEPKREKTGRTFEFYDAAGTPVIFEEWCEINRETGRMFMEMYIRNKRPDNLMGIKWPDQPNEPAKVDSEAYTLPEDAVEDLAAL